MAIRRLVNWAGYHYRRIDTALFTDSIENASGVGSQDVTAWRDIGCVGDPETLDAVAKVTNAAPADTDYGIATRPIQTSDFWLDLAAGNLTGKTGVNKFGRNPSIADGTTEEIWDGSAVYSFPTTSLMTSISQTTDQAAMRGATIEVQGLDANWDLVVQNATLNASDTTTVVTLATPLIRCFRMKVLANVVGDSDIRVHNAGETQDYAVISAGNNQTEMAIYTVPNGKTAYMVSYYSSLNSSAQVGPTGLTIRMWERDNDNVYAPMIKHVTGLDPDATSTLPQHDYRPYKKITQKTDLWITASPTGKAADVSAGFDLILVDN